jgi:gamma-glutamylcyclotransferase (GGCT)/AIG2-like uncharacterized protein YtfP
MLIWTYGMLTDPSLMPHSAFLGVAQLPKFRLQFDQWATVVPDPDCCVSGALWTITPKILSKLDVVEGVPVLYNRQQLLVVCDQHTMEAQVYVKTKQQRPPQAPTQRYITTMRRGYNMCGIDQRQIDQALKEFEQ